MGPSTAEVRHGSADLILFDAAFVLMKVIVSASSEELNRI